MSDDPTTQHDRAAAAMPSRSRERTEIPFPYEDLNSAVEIARVAHESYGGHCELADAAAMLNQTLKSGAFRSKVGAARMFGFIAPKRGTIAVTDLGRRVLNEATERAAKAEAFLNVPLFARLYDEFRASTLPPVAGLEARIRFHGVPEKQVRHARLVFLRSANHAGYFAVSPDRLVRPPVSSEHTVQVDHGDSEAPDELPTQDDEAAIRGKPAIIVEVFKRLPGEGEEFTPEERERWASALKATLDLIYPESTQANGRSRHVRLDDAIGPEEQDSADRTTRR